MNNQVPVLACCGGLRHAGGLRQHVDPSKRGRPAKTGGEAPASFGRAKASQQADLSRNHMHTALWVAIVPPLGGMVPRLLLFAMSLVFLLSTPACAGWAEARSAHAAGNHAKVFQELWTQARLGDPLAQFDVGVMYSTGRGVTQDQVEALKWYQLSAYNGLPEAQLVLGITHQVAQLFGRGTPEDPAEAERWFRLAAEHGLAEAQFYLGQILETNVTGPGSRTDAIEWYRAAAEQGFTLAQDALAETYRFGTQLDNIEALKWYLVGSGSNACRTAVEEAMRSPAGNDPSIVAVDELSCLDLLSVVLAPDQMGDALRLADRVASRVGGVKIEPLKFELIFPDMLR